MHNVLPQWTPRVPKWKLRRFYESDAEGILDTELLADIGMTLLLRCEDILTVQQAQMGEVVCPVCRSQGVGSLLPRAEKLHCPLCGWSVSWRSYRQSYRRQQLNAGGAVETFRAYVKQFPKAKSDLEKMQAIDRLIHEFHYSLRQQPDQPTRSVGVNLIEGNLSSVMEFLEGLSNNAAWEAKVPVASLAGSVR